MVQTPTSTDTFLGLDVSDLAFVKKSVISIRRKISKRFFLIEFGIDSLTYGEARVNKDQIFCTKINRVKIDKDAIEKGTPTDPETMAEFLKQIIEEEKIWAHRVAITLPPEASLARIIYLPERLSYQDAINFVSNPAKTGFQYPIALAQTDFDIIPINCLPNNENNKTKPYFLTCIPSKLVENIISTLTKADLELHSLDIAYSSVGRLANSSINKLKSNQALLILELCIECSHLYVITSSGPIYINALAAIRAFETTNNYESNLSIEEATINSDDYHHVSNLDLKVLLAEIKIELDKIKKNYKLDFTEILLTGINSSHPGISDIIKESFNITTSILRSMSSDEIGDINYTKEICVQELNRIIGLSLTMTESEKLFLDDTDSKNNLINSQPKNNNNSYDIKETKNQNNFNGFLSEFESNKNNKLPSVSSEKDSDIALKSTDNSITSNKDNNNELSNINNSENNIHSDPNINENNKPNPKVIINNDSYNIKGESSKNSFDDFLLEFESDRHKNLDSDSSKNNSDIPLKSTDNQLTSIEDNNNEFSLINNSEDNTISDSSIDKNIMTIPKVKKDSNQSKEEKNLNIIDSKNDNKHQSPQSKDKPNKTESEFKMPED